jgi:hypothetical protein
MLSLYNPLESAELDSSSFPNQTNSRKYTKEHMLSLYNPLETAEFTSQIRRTENKVYKFNVE